MTWPKWLRLPGRRRRVEPRVVTLKPSPELEHAERQARDAVAAAAAARRRWEEAHGIRYVVRPHMGIAHPKPGDVELLVYGECPCNPIMPFRCACPEGSMWPRCPFCGETVLPPAGEPGNPGGRRGYVAELRDEPEAVREVARRKPKPPGLPAWVTDPAAPAPEREDAEVNL